MEPIALIILLVVMCLLLTKYLIVMYECYRKVFVVTKYNAKSKNSAGDIVNVYNQAPGPSPWPFLGNLALLGKFENPFEGFTQLAKKFGDVYTLTLGGTRCLIVNNLDLIREVLNQNGKFFGGRPDFIRYNWLFGGDRNNSLALCDWSQLQQKRRNLARKFCSPKDASSFFTRMSDVGCFEMEEFMDKLKATVVPGKDFALKPLVMQTCANMFSQYMCSVRFDYEDKDFQKIVHYFDEIFWEINQGYAIDFLPWLLPFYLPHLNKISNWATTIRSFILDRIVNQRERNIDKDELEKDFTDALLKNLADDPSVSRDTIIYMLEDFLGGHSAIGNLIMLALAFIVRYPDIGREIQKEVDAVTNSGERKVNLCDTENMPYTIATVYEVLRYASSPIVPHVATEDASIKGYGVTKGTIVFINNYELNTSEKYWSNPESFDPGRFIEKIQVDQMKQKLNAELESNFVQNVQSEPIRVFDNKEYVRRVRKNIPHFLPFSIGKRTCIGQNLVRGFGFMMLANILQSYEVSSEFPEQIKTYPACVALPPETFTLCLTPRKKPDLK